MRYLISETEGQKLGLLNFHLPSMIGGELKRIIKTAKFEESYSSRLFKKPVIINNLYKHRDDGFKLTFKQFICNSQGQLSYTKTPNDYINNMVDDAISKFNLFKSFVYKDIYKGKDGVSDGFETLKFDLILSVSLRPDGFFIDQLQVMLNKQKRFSFYIKDQEFPPNLYFEIHYTSDGVVVESSTLTRFIKTVELVWDFTLDFNKLDIQGMKTITEMLLI